MSTLAFVHVQSMRLHTGQEALVARALMKDGKAGFGFSLRLDATEARLMAMFDAGLSDERPGIELALGHPWEKAYMEGKAIPWETEPAFAALTWLSS